MNFVCGAEEKEWIKKYADLTGDLHTDLHECLGHGSGQLLPGVDQDALKAYWIYDRRGTCRFIRFVLSAG